MTYKNTFKAFQRFAADETGSNHLLVLWRELKLNHEETAVCHEETAVFDLPGVQEGLQGELSGISGKIEAEEMETPKEIRKQIANR